MIDDPYQVLGLSKGASEQEIKKAYRKCAKQWHPDLHPNDPAAARKMNEINEAYDMLMNPEKYAAREAAKQQQQQQRASYQQQQTNQTGYRGSGQQQNPGGRYSDFDFDDFFGFGFYGSGGGDSTRPTVQPGDSIAVQRAIQAIDSRQYQSAVSILATVVSAERNARWYYLNAVANYGCGNRVQAMDHIRRAIELEPDNRAYRQLYQLYGQGSRTYEANAQDFAQGAEQMQKLCLGLCAAHLCCNPFGCFRCM